MADIIDGTAVAEQIRAELNEEIAALAEQGVRPGIATVLAGDDYGAGVYRRQVERVATEAGIAYRDVTLPSDTTLAAVVHQVRELSQDPSVHGILPLRPLPRGVPEGPVLEALDPVKEA